MGLANGGLARVFGAALAPFYQSGTLHRKQAATRDAGGSVVSGGGFVEVGCLAQLDTTGERMRQAEGYTDRDIRILVLATSLSGTITSDDEISVGGTRWSIESVDRDPAGACYELRGRRG